MRARVRLGVLLAGLGQILILLWLSWYWTEQGAPAPRRHAVADFGSVIVSPDVRYTVNWVLASGDNASMDFVVIDKRSAHLYVLNEVGRLRGSTPVLLGAAFGDISPPGIGLVAIADVKPAQRVTPAGRFLAERGHNLRGEDVVWLDYEAALSIHRVVSSNAQERRLERLNSHSSEDNRISYGCINVEPQFYEDYIRPIFSSRRAMIYVLPETINVQSLFYSHTEVQVVQRN